MPFVCVQPMLTSWARRSEDLTSDKTDEKDAVLIARLTAQLRCYVPEPVDETWGRLRHLGARREQLVIDMVSQVQQMRALLECVWPAALDTAKQPFRSRTWTAAMTMICQRDGGDLARTRRLGADRFEQAVRREITRRGGRKPSLRILRQLFTATSDSTGVTGHRSGALERIAFLLQDWQAAAGKLADTETRMTAVLDELKLTELAISIPGLSAVGAAAILAETGDPNRFATARALVKHAGLAPREKLSGTFVGRTKLTGQAARPTSGRLAGGLGHPTRQPGLRSPLPASDQAGDQQTHPDPSPDRDRRGHPAPTARRDHHPPRMGPAHRHPRHPPAQAAGTSRLIPRQGGQAGGRGEPCAALRNPPVTSTHIMGSPARRLINPITRCWGPTPSPLCRDRRRPRHRPTLDTKRLTLMSGCLMGIENG